MFCQHDADGLLQQSGRVVSQAAFAAHRSRAAPPPPFRKGIFLKGHPSDSPSASALPRRCARSGETRTRAPSHPSQPRRSNASAVRVREARDAGAGADQAARLRGRARVVPGDVPRGELRSGRHRGALREDEPVDFEARRDKGPALPEAATGAGEACPGGRGRGVRRRSGCGRTRRLREVAGRPPLGGGPLHALHPGLVRARLLHAERDGAGGLRRDGGVQPGSGARNPLERPGAGDPLAGGAAESCRRRTRRGPCSARRTWTKPGRAARRLVPPRRRSGGVQGTAHRRRGAGVPRGGAHRVGDRDGAGVCRPRHRRGRLQPGRNARGGLEGGGRSDGSNRHGAQRGRRRGDGAGLSARRRAGLRRRREDGRRRADGAGVPLDAAGRGDRGRLRLCEGEPVPRARRRCR